MQASANWVSEERFVGAATSGHAIVVDAGDPKLGNSPMELVLIGLCGCMASNIATILRKKRQSWTLLQVSADAQRAPGPPRVFTSIRLVYRVSRSVSPKAMEDAVRLSGEKYCSVAQMLARTAAITAEIEYVE
jgi:putative redox protein